MSIKAEVSAFNWHRFLGSFRDKCLVTWIINDNTYDGFFYTVNGSFSELKCVQTKWLWEVEGWNGGEPYSVDIWHKKREHKFDK